MPTVPALTAPVLVPAHVHVPAAEEQAAPQRIFTIPNLSLSSLSYLRNNLDLPINREVFSL